VRHAAAEWPPLPLDGWRDTYATLHMWMQIVGKIALALTPAVNHFWNTAFHIAPRGLTTVPMTADDRTFTIGFDFVAHRLVFESSDGRVETIALEPRSVADMYRLVMETVRRLGVEVRIWPMPVEVPSPVRFDADAAHASYDRASAEAFWHLLLAIKPVFDDFRGTFIGKCSPVHFFWGSCDLAVTRFSGRRAPERPNADPITREAYSHEVISHGFWPGGGAIQEPAFYAYCAPEPAGFKEAVVGPPAAFYSADFSEFFLPYDAVRTGASPAAALRTFLESTYDAGARLAGWDRGNLERS